MGGIDSPACLMILGFDVTGVRPWEELVGVAMLPVP
jgi:hypothetical protein